MREERLSVLELAERAGVSAAYIRRLLGNNTIAGIKHGTTRGGYWEIPDSEARRWLSSRSGRDEV